MYDTDEEMLATCEVLCDGSKHLGGWQYGGASQAFWRETFETTSSEKRNPGIIFETCEKVQQSFDRKTHIYSLSSA